LPYTFRKRIRFLEAMKQQGKALMIGSLWILELRTENKGFGNVESLIQYCNRNQIEVTNKESLIPKYRNQLLQ
jgi:hypothetical protein